MATTAETRTERIEAQLKGIPAKPGVYLYRGAKDAVGAVQLNLAPGAWRVEVRLEGLRPAAGDLVVPQDARLEVVADLTVDMSCAIIIACPLAPGDRYLPAQYTFYNDGYAWPLPMR